MTDKGSCNWSCSQCVRPGDIVQCQSQNQWAITYDDGPTNATIPILDYLQQHNARVTFCVIGSRVKEFPQILLRAYQEGHQICVHSWSHRAMTTQTTEQLVAELEWTRLIVEQVTGQSPKYFRPPFGDYADDRVRAVANAMGMTAIIWNFDSSDFNLAYNNSALPPNEIETRVQAALAITNRTSGIISLQHDINTNTSVHAIPVANEIFQANKIVMTASECNGVLQPYKNQNVRLPPSMQQVQPIADDATTSPSTVTVDLPAATYGSTPKNSAMKDSFMALVLLLLH
ncbi:hypothetical protein EDD86DRAFT_193260 [Gorgonomyces haynaldii]|nr:hypothetical protein EDD86DRAFT_193260 [Gorgonomyces haynaldii]